MPDLLYRIDDRLVHGQVVIGWGKPMDIGLIALVDDTVAESEWEQELYRMGVPPEIALECCSLAQAVTRAAAWRADARNSIVLTAEVATMVALCRAVPPVERVVLGGLHHKPGRSARLPYVYLTEDELRLLDGLAAEGVKIEAQDLPTSAPVPLSALR
jgi:PTS system mannose-specific IIB component/fructoselysine and glucoselysine-specific PTS system IIB component